MPIFDKFSKRVGDAAKTAAKKSGEMLEITKLNRSISTEEDKINKLYIEMGKVIYEKYGTSENLDTQLSEWCQQISVINKNIEEMKAKVLELKNIRVCPKCGSEIESGVMFCPKCGTKIEAPVDEEKPVNEGSDSDTSEKA